MKETKIKRRKTKAQRKEDSLRIRVTDAQKKTITDAATRAGIAVSPWAVLVLLREAKKTEGEAS
jgi:uncharacterized protein (DUF1778 family)